MKKRTLYILSVIATVLSMSLTVMGGVSMETPLMPTGLAIFLLLGATFVIAVGMAFLYDKAAMASMWAYLWINLTIIAVTMLASFLLMVLRHEFGIGGTVGLFLYSCILVPILFSIPVIPVVICYNRIAKRKRLASPPGNAP